MASTARLTRGAGQAESDTSETEDAEDPVLEIDRQGPILDSLEEALRSPDPRVLKPMIEEFMATHYRENPGLACEFLGEQLSSRLVADRSDIRLEAMPHWEQSIIFTTKNRSLHKSWVLHNAAITMWPPLSEMPCETVLRAVAACGMPPGTIEMVKEAVQGPVATNGRWFWLDFSHETQSSLFSDEHLWTESPKTNWQSAWHGTSLHNLPTIVVRGMQPGPNAIPDKNGRLNPKVYCEGEARKNCAFMYSTHVGVPGIAPSLTFGCLVELLVDRSRGQSNRGQWMQEQGSAHPVGAWIHVADLRNAYQPGHVGTLRIHRPQYEIGIRGLKKGDFLQDAMCYQAGVTKSTAS